MTFFTRPSFLLAVFLACTAVGCQTQVEPQPQAAAQPKALTREPVLGAIDKENTRIDATTDASYTKSVEAINRGLTFDERKDFDGGIWYLFSKREISTDPSEAARKALAIYHYKTAAEIIAIGASEGDGEGRYQRRRKGTPFGRDFYETSIYNKMVETVNTLRKSNPQLPELLPFDQAKIELDSVQRGLQMALWGKCADAQGQWHEFQAVGSIDGTQLQELILDFQEIAASDLEAASTK